MRLCYYFVLFCVSVCCGSTIKLDADPEEEIVRKVIEECIASNQRLSCFSEKAAIAIERSINWDIPIFDGVNLVRNEKTLNLSEARSLDGFTRLTSALSNFVKSHTFSVDLSEPRGINKVVSYTLGGNRPNQNYDSDEHDDRDGGGDGGGHGGGGGGGGGGSFMGYNKKAVKKEKKYMQYAFMVLLGIFGLTGPLVMKTLAIMAAKALMASKAALIIVGSVALKKIFEHDHHDPKPNVKVHTIPSYDHHEDEHDRISYNYLPSYSAYSPYNTYTTTYSAYNTPYSYAKPIR